MNPTRTHLSSIDTMLINLLASEYSYPPTTHHPQNPHCLNQSPIHSGPTGFESRIAELLSTVRSVSNTTSPPAIPIASKNSNNLTPGFFPISTDFSAADDFRASNQVLKLTGSTFSLKYLTIAGTRAFHEPGRGFTMLWYRVQGSTDDSPSLMSERRRSTMMFAVISTGIQAAESWPGRLVGTLPRCLELAMS